MKAIFWDMDGTMTDTEKHWAEATFALSEAMGRRIPDYTPIAGASTEATIKSCADYAEIQLDEHSLEYYRAMLLGSVEILLDKGALPNAGVRELLADLQAHAVPMYVVTNTDRQLLSKALRGIGENFFVGSIAGDEVEYPKPAPDMYLEAARQVEAHPSRCLVFEDSWNGMSSAVAAGCQVIGLVEPEQPYPRGVVPLHDLHGSNSLEGVTASQVKAWFSRM